MSRAVTELNNGTGCRCGCCGNGDTDSGHHGGRGGCAPYHSGVVYQVGVDCLGINEYPNHHPESVYQNENDHDGRIHYHLWNHHRRSHSQCRHGQEDFLDLVDVAGLLDLLATDFRRVVRRFGLRSLPPVRREADNSSAGFVYSGSLTFLGGRISVSVAYFPQPNDNI